jgi:type IV pilus assembly protein PilM
MSTLSLCKTATKSITSRTIRKSSRLLNIGASTMNVNIVQGTRSLFTRDITVGGSQFTDVLQRSLGFSFQQAEAVKRGVMDASEKSKKKPSSLDGQRDGNGRDGNSKTFDFYRATSEDSEMQRAENTDFRRRFKTRRTRRRAFGALELPVEVLDPFRNIKVDTRKFDPDYLSEIMPEMAVAVGLAVRGVELR